MRSRLFIHDTAYSAMYLLTFALIVQAGHEVEHILQIIQKYVLHWTTFPGLMGQWFDFEWVHVVYNGSLWLALFATWYLLRGSAGSDYQHGAGAASLNFLVLFQGYHLFEHLVRLAQYLQGNPHPPGVLGQVVPVLELHFWLNSIVTAAIVVTYYYYRGWRFVLDS